MKTRVIYWSATNLFAWLNGMFPSVVNIGLKKQTALARAFLIKPKTKLFDWAIIRTRRNRKLSMDCVKKLEV